MLDRGKLGQWGRRGDLKLGNENMLREGELKAPSFFFLKIEGIS